MLCKLFLDLGMGIDSAIYVTASWGGFFFASCAAAASIPPRRKEELRLTTPGKFPGRWKKVEKLNMVSQPHRPKLRRRLPTDRISDALKRRRSKRCDFPGPDENPISQKQG